MTEDNQNKKKNSFLNAIHSIYIEFKQNQKEIDQECKQIQKEWVQIKKEKSFKPFKFENNEEDIAFKINFLTKWHKDTVTYLCMIIIILLSLLLLSFAPNFILASAASFCADIKQYEQAEKIYYTLIKYEAFIYKDKNLQKINPKYLEKLANIYFRQGEYKLAIMCYKGIIRNYSFISDRYTTYYKIPTSYKIPIYIKMGDLYYLEDDKKNQYEMYKKAVETCKQTHMLPEKSLFDFVIRDKMIGENK